MNRLLAIAAGVGLATIAGAQGKSATNNGPLQITADNKGDVINVPVVGSQSTSRATTILDISGEQSWDSLYDSSNTILYVPINAGDLMTGIGWDVNLATIGYSWLSEARFYFDGSDRDGYGLFLTPGYLDGTPGTGYYTNSVIDLVANGIPYIPIQADGQLWIELFEGYDDVNDAADADWLTTSLLTIEHGGAPSPPCYLWVEDFDSGVWPPAGWGVVDNTTAGQVWQLSSYFGNSNGCPGGSGECADIDADAYGSSGTRDSELWSAPFTVPAGGGKLGWGMDYQNYAFIDFADVDISTDGGTTWTNLVSYNSDLTGFFDVDLSAYAGMSVMVRFHYYDFGNWGWWWQVDNVGMQAIASAAFRNAGTNPASLTLSGPPVMDANFQATMDVGSTGHAFGQLFGYAGALTYTLGGGQTVLTDFTHPAGELLVLPVLAGPTVMYDIYVPPLCGLQGLFVAMQGAHFGGAPWVLSNAQDVVVGY